jgi:hypothetical protein
MTLARNYNSIPAVILEAVQNAIDAGALRVAIEINKPKGSLFVYDNGNGAGRERVNTALKSIAATLKERDKFGQFGIGLISPLAISKRFTFTSCPTPRYNGYVEYIFVTKEIEQSAEPDIPFEELPALTFDPNGKTWWRSRLIVTGLTRERRPSTVVPKDLATSIALKFGEAIRERAIDISIDMTDEKGEQTTTVVEAPRFKGIKLDVFTDERPESGEVKVELFIAPRQTTGRKGVILFGSFDNPSRITNDQFVRCAKDILEPAVVKVIMSGAFEGTVLSKKIVLHPNRTSFEDNDALFALCEIMEAWFKKVGKATFESIGEESKNELFQEIGLKVMPLIEALAAQPQFAEIMKAIKVGTIGGGHADVKKKDIIGKDEAGPSLSIDGGLGTKREEGSSDTDSDKRDKKQKERPTHRPSIVNGPKGKTRTEVRSNSTGLRLQHTEFDDFRIPFEFERESGTLSINTRHAYFGQCQRDRSSLQKYHSLVATAAFSLEVHRSKDGRITPELVEFTHSSLENYVFGILNEKALIG